jgi:hypothetical protein
MSKQIIPTMNFVDSKFSIGKSPFLTMQLSPQFGFGHRTSKPDIFDHLTLKTVHN